MRKLTVSLHRELTLLSRSFYFYVEIATTAIFLIILLIVVPENIDKRVTEYFFFDMPAQTAGIVEEAMMTGVKNVQKEEVTIQVDKQDVGVKRYTTDEKYMYVFPSREALIAAAKETGNIGVVVHMPDESVMYEVYLQGYETEQYTRYISLIAADNISDTITAAQNQKVVALQQAPIKLNDRQSMLPMMLTVNCIIMGIMVIAGYIFEDKKANVIRALRVAPAGIGNYLSAKTAAVLFTSLISSLILTIPVMRQHANYLLLMLTVVCAGFFMIMLGSIIASYFDDFAKSFAIIFAALIALLVPAVGGMIPTWNPWWMKLFPSYYALEAVQSALINADAGYVLMVCGGYIIGGIALFLFAVRRYKTEGLRG